MSFSNLHLSYLLTVRKSFRVQLLCNLFVFYSLCPMVVGLAKRQLITKSGFIWIICFGLPAYIRNSVRS